MGNLRHHAGRGEHDFACSDPFPAGERGGGDQPRPGDALRANSYVTDLTALARNPTLVNMPVQGGDVIDVPLAGMFFVDGAVGKPGTYPLNGAYTLTQALAVAGGMDQILASYSDISIFRRRIGSEPERIAVNLKQVLAGQALDPAIEVEDTIVVPMSTAKYVIHHFTGRMGLATVRTF